MGTGGGDSRGPRGGTHPGEVRISRFVRWSVCVLGLSLSLAAFPGSAQAARPARPDSLAGLSVLDRLNFHPSYSSRYSVNRTSRIWDQSMSISRPLLGLDFSNSWSVKNRRDKAQSNLRAKSGMMKLNLDYVLGEDRAWTVGVEGSFKRDALLSILRDQIENRSDMTLATTSKYPERLLHRLGPMKEFTLRSGANFGYSAERNVSRRATARDSTRVGGLLQQYDLGLDGGVGGVDLSLGMNADRRTGDSRTKHMTSQGRLTEEKDATKNRTQRWDASAGWKSGAAFETRTDAHWLHDLNEYWDIQANNGEGGQESKDGRDIGAQTKLDWKPAKDLAFHGELRSGVSQATFALQARDFKKTTNAGSLDGTVKLPAIAGPAAGTELQLSYSADEARNDLEETADYRQANRKLRGSFRRQLGQKVQTQVTEDVSILQYFYQDGSNDRDEQRVTTDAILSYSPSMKYNGYLNYNLSERKLISIPGSKAINNNTTQTYKVSGTLDYNRGPMKVSQRYTIQADYTFYDFDENRNALVRTNGVQTNFDHRIGPRLALALAHEYQFRESGSYTRAQAGGARAYAPSSQETKQMMSLKMSYPFGEVLRIEARQMFERRENLTISTRRVNTTDRGEFSMRAELRQKFSDVFNVNASFQKTESISERDYWTVDASVQRIF